MRALAALAVAFALVAGSACATPSAMKSGRKGLLDRLSELPSTARATARATGRATKNKRGRAIAQEAETSPGFEERIEAYRKVDLRWPLANVQVTSQYGDRGKEFHDGVDLRAARGTSVYASHAGTVLYSGSRISGYGRMVILKHPTGLATVYAHNTRNLVRQGQRVRQGQKIALSGNTGRSSGPHLHFEIRDGVTALDPMQFLPDSTHQTLARVEEIKNETPAARPARAKTAKIKPVVAKKASNSNSSARKPASLVTTESPPPRKSKPLAKSD